MQAQRPLENVIAENCVQFSGYNPEAVGIDWLEGPPVPIPNTEVKLKFVDESMRVTACENR